MLIVAVLGVVSSSSEWGLGSTGKLAPAAAAAGGPLAAPAMPENSSGSGGRVL